MKLMDFTDINNKFKQMSEVPGEYFDGLKEMVRNSAYYPEFHIAPPHGLMNDPNGLCQIDGWYHIFYQWFPLGPVHGLKHWYHLKTRDFVDYIDLGVAMYPDTELDQDGCYTGVTVRRNEEWIIYYTGVDRNKGQQVCRAIFDGKSRITDKQVCIPHDPKLTTCNFRDPFLYKDKYMLVGAQTHEEKGKIALYERSKTGFGFKGFMKMPEELSGYMVECPNLIPINEKEDLLIFSPQGIESPDRFTYRNVFSVVYGVGRFDGDKCIFDCDQYREVDKGFDFYAPQIFRDEKGRDILMAWLGNSKCVYPSDFEQWAHMMTIPREIHCENGRLRQLPLEELKALRKEKIVLKEHMLLSEKCFELEFNADVDFEICLCNEKGEKLVFGGNRKEYCLDRGKTSHVYNEIYGTRRYAVRDMSREQKIHMYVDRSAIEIFADDGYVVFTSRFFIDALSEIFFKGGSGTMYLLDSIKYKLDE